MPEVSSIDAAALTNVVRQALGSPTAEIAQWDRHSISYINTEEANLGVHRFSGTAHDPTGDRPWSLVLKAVQAPVIADPSFWNYHRREILAYQAGLLAALPGGLRAPRCFGATEFADGGCWIWLEAFPDEARQPWKLADYGLAARDLGRFNGAYLVGRPLPAATWLSRGWLRGWLSEFAPARPAWHCCRTGNSGNTRCCKLLFLAQSPRTSCGCGPATTRF